MSRPLFGVQVAARSRLSRYARCVASGVPRVVQKSRFTRRENETSVVSNRYAGTNCRMKLQTRVLSSPRASQLSPRFQPRGTEVTAHASFSSDIPGIHGDANDEPPTDPGKSARVAFYITTWYFLNAIFAIINKRTLQIFPHPWLLSWVQIAVGAGFVLFTWRLRLIPPPDVEWNWKTFALLAPPSVLHLIAHCTACASYAFGTVSFMQVVKAAEPAVAVVLLSLFFKRKYTKFVWLTMLPIVLGVAVGSLTEVHFSGVSFACAMASNVASALRSVTSKDLQIETGLAGVNLYGAMSVVGAALLLPISLAMEGGKIGGAYVAAKTEMAANGVTLRTGFETPFLAYLIVGGLLFHLYNQTSYQALAELNPLDISVANAVKRVVIILASVAVFRNPITAIGGVSAAVAIFGTFLYSIAAAKQTSEEKKVIDLNSIAS